MSSSEDEVLSTSCDSSSEDDEHKRLIMEAASCDYVKKLYSNHLDSHIDKPKKKIKYLPESKETAISSHQTFLAKRLNERLENLIKVVEPPISLPSSSLSPLKGIQLFRDSVLIDEVSEDEDDALSRKCPKNSSPLSNNEYASRAKQVAVTCDWLVATNIKWTDHKRPKLINLKVVNKFPDDKLECEVISSVNIPDKFGLI